MKTFLAFLKKECTEGMRSGKFLFLFILFFAFGIMNPAVAKLTPYLLEILSEELESSGMLITDVTVDALTSWTQFFKNIPMALIAFVLIYGGIFTKEYESGTLILVLTKGISRDKIVLAKAILLFTLWTVGYFLCFAVTYGYNAYYWDNSIAQNLFPAVLYWWLFGVFVISLTVFFSVLSKSYGIVLLLTGGSVLLCSIVGYLPQIADKLPTALTSGMNLLIGAEAPADCTVAVAVTAVLSIGLIGVSIPLFRQKQL